ncbi:hypothetical protein GCM10010304_80890 [Streptomyces roseoviolaceus]
MASLAPADEPDAFGRRRYAKYTPDLRRLTSQPLSLRSKAPAPTSALWRSGLSEKTAIRYANSARALLEQAAEHSTSHSGKVLGPACGALKNDGHADSTGMA